jgi:hypothetical protein
LAEVKALFLIELTCPGWFPIWKAGIFSSGKENRGFARRRTLVRRTSKAED